MGDYRSVKVVDRNNKEIAVFSRIPKTATVEEFKKMLIKECS
jgi:hypothetical protein